MDRRCAVLLKLLCVLGLFSALSAHATLASSVYHVVRTDGVDTNSGCFDPSVTSPGTDFANQAAAQVSFTDLVIGATNTQLTSAANPFTSASVGNCIRITGGTGFTTGLYEVLSVTGSTATMDRAVGTASSTGGTGKLGGAVLTWSQAANDSVGQNVVYVKAGTYTVTGSVSWGPTICLGFQGFNSTYLDTPTGTNRPLLTTSTNSVSALIAAISSSGCYSSFSHLRLSNTAGTPGNGIANNNTHGSYLIVNNVSFSGFGGGTDAGAAICGTNAVFWDWANISVVNSEFTNNKHAIDLNSGAWLVGNYFHGNGDDYFGAGSVTAMFNVFASSTAASAADVNLSNNGSGIIEFNAFYGNTTTTAALNITGGGSTNYQIQNNIFYGNKQAFSGTIGRTYGAWNLQNAFGSNTNASTGWFSVSDITLTANPFTNAAGGDFSLNSTAGGGTLLKAAGWPLTFGGTTTTNLNVGPAQNSGSGGGSTAANSGYAN